MLQTQPAFVAARAARIGAQMSGATRIGVGFSAGIQGVG